MRTPSLTQRLVFSLVRCVGVARCERLGKRLCMDVAQLARHTKAFDDYAEQRRHLVFRSVGPAGMRHLQVTLTRTLTLTLTLTPTLTPTLTLTLTLNLTRWTSPRSRAT